MKILSIDTSCDETSAAVTKGVTILSNIIWSQASLHAKWGGILPSLAQREHKERIDWVINKSLKVSQQSLEKDIDALAVTVGPGLAIALEVGIAKAKEICKKFKKPLIPINHLEGHILSVLASTKKKFTRLTFNPIFPALCFIASGGTTQLIFVKKIGNYEVVAETTDDALGEALDKAARALGLGYPGGVVLEKLAKEGNQRSYNLPIPMAGQEYKLKFSYSGLKTAFYKIIEKEKPLTREKIINLAASFQNTAFIHVERIIKKAIEKYSVKELWLVGGVSANIELRKRIRKICNENEIILRLPYSKRLCTDNAAMIGIAANFKRKKEFLSPPEVDGVERIPGFRVEEDFKKYL